MSEEGRYLRLSKKFIVRNEKGCSFLVRLSTYHDEAKGGSLFELPPFVGHIFSEIGKREYKASVAEIAKRLDVSTASVENFLKSLMADDEMKWMSVEERNPVKLPPDFLVWSDEPDTRMFHVSDDFDPTDDFKMKRPDIPLSVNLMITTACTTDCSYCYADRSLKGQMTNEELIKTIGDLHEAGVANLTITGGDLFAMKGWEDILRAIEANGYGTFISTKTPLDRGQLETLAALGYDHVQFSLDSIDAEIERRLVKVGPDYIDRVRAMFAHCRELGIKVQVRTVVTSLNWSREVLGRLHEFLKESGCVSEWDLTPAFFSKYRKDYEAYRVSPEQLEEAYRYCMGVRSRELPVSFSKMTEGHYVLKKASTPEEFCRTNQRCLAGYSVMSILANGKVTFCEMIYENPYYLFGDIRRQSLDEIWHSKRALELFSPERPSKEDSPCGGCDAFDDCKRAMLKRVCYSDIAKIYGEGDTRHLPDPRCPLATDCDYIL